MSLKNIVLTNFKLDCVEWFEENILKSKKYLYLGIGLTSYLIARKCIDPRLFLIKPPIPEKYIKANLNLKCYLEPIDFVYSEPSSKLNYFKIKHKPNFNWVSGKPSNSSELKVNETITIKLGGIDKLNTEALTLLEKLRPSYNFSFTLTEVKYMDEVEYHGWLFVQDGFKRVSINSLLVKHGMATVQKNIGVVRDERLYFIHEEMVDFEQDCKILGKGIFSKQKKKGVAEEVYRKMSKGGLFRLISNVMSAPGYFKKNIYKL